jgi:aryl carrier-like protein
VTDRHGQPSPIGVAGEIYIGGDLLARGYHGRPDATAERFLPDPFGRAAGGRLYRTGDSARYRSNGELEFLGRMDQQIKIRGYRVELGEIESVLRQHESVRDAVVVMDRSSNQTTRLAGYFVARNGGDPGAHELRSFLRAKLPEYMVPAVFLKLAALPLTPNGKVDRKSLPPLDAAPSDLEASYVAPRSELERTVARVWQEVLKIDRTGVHDNFFELGGHSLLLIQLRARLAEALGKPISMVELFKYPTIDSYSRYLTSEAPPPFAAENGRGAAVDRRLAKKRRRQRRQTAENNE